METGTMFMMFGVEDIDIQEKESGTFKAVASNDVEGHSASNSYTMSIAQRLELVKDTDIKYFPDDYFTLLFRYMADSRKNALLRSNEATLRFAMTRLRVIHFELSL